MGTPILLIIYLICYVISFIIQYYYKIAYKSSFNADLIQMLPMFLLSFVWPVLLVYVIAVTVLKWVSTAVLVVYVYIKDFINNHEIKIILILGHSCNIDFDYFKLLQNQFPQAKWIFIYYDSKTRINMVNMISRFDIKNFELVKDNEYFDEEKADVTGGA